MCYGKTKFVLAYNTRHYKKVQSLQRYLAWTVLRLAML